jgi:hypothetical protein
MRKTYRDPWHCLWYARYISIINWYFGLSLFWNETDYWHYHDMYDISRLEIYSICIFSFPVFPNCNIGPLLGFLILFRHSVWLFWAYDHPIEKASTYTQHRKTTTNIHALSGIRTHDHSDQANKTYASDHSATGTGNIYFCPSLISDEEYYWTQIPVTHHLLMKCFVF